MKKKLAITFVLAVAIFGCGKIGGINTTPVIEATTLPVKIGADLVAPAQPSNTVLVGYNVILDGSIVSAAPITCTSGTTCPVQFLVGSIGSHSVAYSASYKLLDVDPNSVVTSAAGPSTPFIVANDANAPAVAPANLKKN